MEYSPSRSALAPAEGAVGVLFYGEGLGGLAAGVGAEPLIHAAGGPVGGGEGPGVGVGVEGDGGAGESAEHAG